jgi:hypothetical protein
LCAVKKENENISSSTVKIYCMEIKIGFHAIYKIKIASKGCYIPISL